MIFYIDIAIAQADMKTGAWSDVKFYLNIIDTCCFSRIYFLYGDRH